MAKHEITEGELVDRLLDEEPANIRTFLQVVAGAARLQEKEDWKDYDLFQDWFNTPIKAEQLKVELAARTDKFHTLIEALKPPQS